MSGSLVDQLKCAGGNLGPQPQGGKPFSGFFGGNALTNFSGSYVDIRAVVADIQTLANWIQAQSSVQALILSTYPQSPNGLLPGALYWDGSVFSRAPADPSTYPTSAAGLSSGDVWFNGVNYVVVP